VRPQLSHPKFHFENLSSLCDIWRERNHGFLRLVCAKAILRGNIVIGRLYFTRQATTLLKFARSTTDPRLAAVLVEKAADLKSQIDETAPTPDTSPRAPDVLP
jgi:hypothetical protein